MLDRFRICLPLFSVKASQSMTRVFKQKSKLDTPFPLLPITRSLLPNVRFGTDYLL